MISHFNAESTTNSDFAVLSGFFQQLSQLEALRYLHSISKMVLTLHSTLSRQIDRSYAQSTDLATVLKSATIFNDSSAEIIRTGAENFRKIWLLIKPTMSQKLMNRFAKCTYLLLDDTTVSCEQLPLSFFLASSSNDGSFIYSTLFYLINLQNEFLQFTRNKTRASQGDNLNENAEIELDALTTNDCISFLVDKDLMQIVYMNTSYSYESKDQVNLEYDFTKMQISVVKRFLEEKAVIKSNKIPLIEYSDDINDISRFQALHKNVAQIELEYAIKEKITSFYKQPNELNDIIRIIHIVIDFVISSGCSSNMKIIDYAINVLKMTNIEDSKISKHVTYSFIGV